MKNYLGIFKSSAMEFYNLRSLAVCGMLIAVSVAIESLTITLPMNIKLNFSFLAVAAIGMLFGPVMGVCSAAVCDVLGYFVSPMGGFMPAYTLVAMVQGLIYGMIAYRVLYDRENSSIVAYLKWPIYIRMVVARAVDIVVVNLFLNTCLNLHYGFISAESLGVAIAGRVSKNVLEFIICDILLLCAVMPAVLTGFNAVFNRGRMKKRGTAA